MDYNTLIVGAGVVGLAIAERISRKEKTLLIERHESFGRETSSRNSEVIHAGIYYPKDSIKARLCVPGNKSLYNWAEKYNVPHCRIGKFIVAVNKSEEAELELIYEKARNNGVDNIQHFSIEKLREIEPNVRAVAALWSPDTGIIDSHQLMASFEQKALENGCDIAYKHSFKSAEKINGGYRVEIVGPEGETFTIETEKIINSAGLDADIVAQDSGFDIQRKEYELHYARGHYFRLKPKLKGLVNHLIYPVPLKKMHILGIHITLELSGEMKLGPDIEYLEKREQVYRVDETHQQKFFDSASSYLKGLQFDDIYPDQSGIRPKLQAKDGDYRDFVIQEESESGFPGFINLIGIESPGLTSSLEIAKMVERL
jgi:L-2-hydroxyglutarate oxidase LhgO